MLAFAVSKIFVAIESNVAPKGNQKDVLVGKGLP
jgi:hypothetical protein